MNSLYDRYPVLIREKNNIEQAIELIIDTYNSMGKLLLCGNGGSAADCDHIAGELMKGFLKKRPISNQLYDSFAMLGEEEMTKYLQGSLPAISLVNPNALISAFCNDVHPDYVYAQQIIGLGRPGDVLIGITTSGNAVNVQKAVIAAKALGMKTIGLTGESGGWLAKNADIVIRAPEKETYRIQEYHLPIYHWICACVEQYFFD